MRISEDTPERLVLRDRTAWVSLVCLAGAAALLVRFAMVGEKGLLIGATVSALFSLPFLRATDLVFDKVQHICTMRRLDLWRMTRLNLAFRDIHDLRVEVEPMGGDSHVISCRFSLVTASAAVPLTISYEPDLERYDRMRDQILEVLFSPSRRPAATDPVEDLVKHGQVVSAVALLRKRDGMDLVSAKARVDEMRQTLGAPK